MVTPERIQPIPVDNAVSSEHAKIEFDPKLQCFFIQDGHLRLVVLVI